MGALSVSGGWLGWLTGCQVNGRPSPASSKSDEWTSSRTSKATAAAVDFVIGGSSLKRERGMESAGFAGHGTWLGVLAVGTDDDWRDSYE